MVQAQRLHGGKSRGSVDSLPLALFVHSFTSITKNIPAGAKAMQECCGLHCFPLAKPEVTLIAFASTR